MQQGLAYYTYNNNHSSQGKHSEGMSTGFHSPGHDGNQPRSNSSDNFRPLLVPLDSVSKSRNSAFYSMSVRLYGCATACVRLTVSCRATWEFSDDLELFSQLWAHCAWVAMTLTSLSNIKQYYTRRVIVNKN